MAYNYFIPFKLWNNLICSEIQHLIHQYIYMFYYIVETLLVLIIIVG